MLAQQIPQLIFKPVPLRERAPVIFIATVVGGYGAVGAKVANRFLVARFLQFPQAGDQVGKNIAVWMTTDGPAWRTIMPPVPAGATAGVLQQIAITGNRVAALGQVTTAGGVTVPLAELSADGVKVSYGAVWAFFAREGITFKKRACTPASRIAPTSPAGASDGRNTRADLMPNGWSLSTRPGPKPT